MTVVSKKENLRRKFSYAFPLAISGIIYLISYYLGNYLVFSYDNPIFQILIQTNITFLGFYLLCMTFIIKKFEESRREYEKFRSKLLHEADKARSYKGKQILPYGEKYPFHNSPMFNYSLKEAGLTIDDVKKGIESKKKFENYSLDFESNKEELEKSNETNYQYSTYLIRISIFTIVYVLIFSLVFSSIVFLYPVSNSYKWSVVLWSFVALYQMIYTIYQNWMGTNVNVRLIDNNLFHLQNMINDIEAYKKKNNLYFPSPLERQ